MKAASELSGGSPPQSTGGGGGAGGSDAPSALMQEARGATQRSVRLERGARATAIASAKTATISPVSTSKTETAAATVAAAAGSELANPCGDKKGEAARAGGGGGAGGVTEEEVDANAVMAENRLTGKSGGRGEGKGEGQAAGFQQSRTRRWGYRRGPRETLRRNLFGRFAPVFFYPLAQVLYCCCLRYYLRFLPFVFGFEFFSSFCSTAARFG